MLFLSRCATVEKGASTWISTQDNICVARICAKDLVIYRSNNTTTTITMIAVIIICASDHLLLDNYYPVYHGYHTGYSIL